MNPRPPAPLPPSSADDPRLDRLLVDRDAHVAIVGCADDTGVKHSAGRTGAALGPGAVRRWLYRQTTGMNGELEGLRLHDAGDVLPGESIEQTHAEVERVVASLAKTHPLVVFLGGGHDLAYASHSGLLSATDADLHVVNVDTHLDVRPLRDGRITSGTPFRRLLERWPDRIARFTGLGIQPQHNARAHAEWLRQRGGHITTLDELRRRGLAASMAEALPARAACSTFSVDLDVLEAADGPGVSAPPGDGLSAAQLVRLFHLAGRHPALRLVDVVELSPPHDENEKTARTAALGLWRLFASVAARLRAS